MSKAATLQPRGLEALPPSVRGGGGGKRKLDFFKDSQRLRGKVFFFDLQDDPKSLEGIQREITERGGVVDNYFHKQVRYLVTTRHKKGKKTSTGCSPSTLSPDTPEGAASGGRAAAAVGRSSFTHSPVEGGAKVNKAVPVAYYTRAAKIYAKSRALHGGKKVDDMLKMADQWGTKLLTPDELLAELKKFKPLPPPKDDSKKHFKTPSLRELNPPFMKVEDQSRAYRPLIYETDVWPRPNPHCPAHSCPYETPQTSKRGKVTQLSRATGARLTQGLTQELVASQQQVGATVAMAATTAARRKNGYCECCSMRYEDLSMHLRSKKHQDYANNPANFSALDGFIREKGLDIATFLTRIREKTNQGSSVVLITPPTSPRPSDSLTVSAPPGSQSNAQGTPTKRSAAPTTPIRHSVASAKEDPVPTTPAKKAHGTAVLPTTPVRGAREAPPLSSIFTITAGFSSPKRGALCLTPIKILPTGKAVEPTLEQGSHTSCDPHPPSTPTRSSGCPQASKRGRRLEGACPTLPSIKRLKLQSPERKGGSVVPETPEKVERKEGGEEKKLKNGTSSLCNIHNLLFRLDSVTKITDVQYLLDEVTRESPQHSSLATTLSPGTSPLTAKKTPPPGASPLTTRRMSPRLHSKIHPATPTQPFRALRRVPPRSKKTAASTPSNDLQPLNLHPLIISVPLESIRLQEDGTATDGRMMTVDTPTGDGHVLVQDTPTGNSHMMEVDTPIIDGHTTAMDTPTAADSHMTTVDTPTGDGHIATVDTPTAADHMLTTVDTPPTDGPMTTGESPVIPGMPLSQLQQLLQTLITHMTTTPDHMIPGVSIPQIETLLQSFAGVVTDTEDPAMQELLSSVEILQVLLQERKGRGVAVRRSPRICRQRSSKL